MLDMLWLGNGITIEIDDSPLLEKIQRLMPGQSASRWAHIR